MPNHVTSRIIVSGPLSARQAFKDAFIIQTDAPGAGGQIESITEFDFEKIVPMPEILRLTESSSLVSMGLIVLGCPEVAEFGLLPGKSLEDEVALYLSYPHVKAAGVSDYAGLQAYLREVAPDCEEKASMAIRAKEECGHASWYSWSIANWGTKWNAYGFRPLADNEDLLDFRFDTAWSPPDPIFAALAEHAACTDLHLQIRNFDEMWNFACTGIISDGHYVTEDVTPTPAFYEAVYGAPCPVDPEDEEG